MQEWSWLTDYEQAKPTNVYLEPENSSMYVNNGYNVRDGLANAVEVGSIYRNHNTAPDNLMKKMITILFILKLNQNLSEKNNQSNFKWCFIV